MGDDRWLMRWDEAAGGFESFYSFRSCAEPGAAGVVEVLSEVRRTWGGAVSVAPDDRVRDLQEIANVVDIHERDGDPPSLWRVVDAEGRVLAEADARKLSPLQRTSLVPAHVVAEGREIFEEAMGSSESIGEAARKLGIGEEKVQ